MDPETYKLLLTKPQSREVLRIVVDHGNVFFNDLVDQLSKRHDEPPATMNRDQIRQILEELKAADLVKELNAPVKDFDRYYPTAYGLRADRQIGRLIPTDVTP